MSRLFIIFCILTSFNLACTTNGQTVSEPDTPITPPKKVKPLEYIKWSGEYSEGWKQYDKLVGEQKYEVAAKLVEDMLEKAKTTKNSQEWVRALLQYVQLRTALHGYEKSVRFLKEQPWPEDILGKTSLHLFYAQSLVHYAHQYSWEIRKREKVDSKGVVDLKAWTMEQIFTEAHKTYAKIWQHRTQLGLLSNELLSKYIQKNNYPRDIRSTLRDSVSYLWVELLADTTGWRPEHSNQIYQLNLEDMLKNKVPAVDLSDPAVHPLKKTVAILSDLENRHSKHNKIEAAFEARLERLRRLHANFKQDSERRLIKDDLRQRLKKITKQAWWSMGMAVLAEFVRAESRPDNLIRARKIALEGQKAYPKSIGGQRCNYIIKSIELPNYSLQAMASDGLNKRSIMVIHNNIEKLYFRAYGYDLQKHINQADDYNFFLTGDKLDKFIKKNKPVASWQVDLPKTLDYKNHQTFVNPPMTKNGFYVVLSSVNKDFTKSHNQILAANMIISDVVLVTNHKDNQVEVNVLSGKSGRPLSGAKVYLYQYNWNKGHKVAASKTTTQSGSVTFTQKGDHRQYFVFAKHKGQIAADPDYLYLYGRSRGYQTSASLIYTDRSIYRPNQEIHFKTIVYSGRQDKADFKTSPNTTVTVHLMDANYQKVATKTLKTNEFGSASGEFVIPAGRLLGNWQLKASPDGYASIKVEEYKRPTFEAKLLDSKTPLRLNKPASFKGEARYYFGLPVTNAKAVWKVTRTPQYPWWWSYWYYSDYSQGNQSQVVASGSSKIADDGTFEIKFTPKADERQGKKNKSLSYRYAISVEVVDEGGETRTASKSFRLGFVAVEASISSQVDFVSANKSEKFTIQRTNLDGAPAPGKGSWQLVTTKGPAKTLLPAEQPLPEPSDPLMIKYQTSGDKLRKRWQYNYDPAGLMYRWKDGAEKAKGTLAHNDKGQAEVELPKLAPGSYRLYYRTQDAFGENYETLKNFIVVDNNTQLALPALMELEKSSLTVGETARIFLMSGLDDQLLIFDRYHKGKKKERRLLESYKDQTMIEIPITEKDRGGFSFTLWVLRDHQLIQFNRSIYVPWDNKQLKVEFATFRDKLTPGAKEKWSVKVSGPQKDQALASAEILAYMYDRSLDVFAPHYPPSPSSLFPYFTGTPATKTSLGQARHSWVRSHGYRSLPSYPSLHGDRLIFYDGYGIGGLGQRRYRVTSGATALPASAPRKMKKEVSLEKKMEYAFSDTATGGKLAEAEDAEPEAPADKRNEAGPPAAQSQEQVQLRSNFQETSFWYPHLITDKDGSVSFEYTVPDSVTSWNVWVHAITRDLKSGSIKKEAQTVKDLMVRPYLPRFLREGDQAQIKVVVNNASDQKMEGTLNFDIIDPQTEKSILAEFGLTKKETSKIAFSAEPQKGTNLSFALKTPPKVGLIAFRVTATSGNFSDGELRPIPILPGRMHLAQSRFVTLKNKALREMKFEDLIKDDDPTRINEQLVVTLDAQLFYSVLSALPYLVNYPYECTEQTLNRFLSTGILSSMYKDYPAIKKMAAKFSKRETAYEQWDDNDPNRKMALEETPWLRQAKGGRIDKHHLINVLDPKITKAQRDASLRKLKKAQTSSGGFPWFSGGPPSPYITLYILHGFSKGLEFGVDVPKSNIQRAWSYMKRHYVDELVQWMIGHDCCWEFITFLNYVLTNYPDSSWSNSVFSKDDQKKMLDFSFAHWKRHAPYLKAYLALTLHRMDRKQDALLVWESVMDSAKTKQDQGTFWAPEDRAWLWYNDTIESHAFAVRTVMELMPKNEKLDGLVLWLFLNKKMNHWKSTKATAEVVYSLAHYLKKTAQLGIKEEAQVTIGDLKKSFVFLPDEYTGKKNQIVVAGKDIQPKNSKVTIEKETKGFMLASATWHFSTEQLPKEARGDYLNVTRKYFKRIKSGREVILKPLAEGAKLVPGDEVEVQISLSSKHPMEYVHLRDPRPAGFEPVSNVSKHKWSLGIYWYEEVRDSGMNFFFEKLPQGEYPFKYRIRAAVAGTFKAGPATIQPMYAPEFSAYSSGAKLTISPME
jgi:uncharacterized protein YfaS (alpha-2-macroglobulin family)